VMARSLARSKDIALGGFYRRLEVRRGGLVANIALARKLAAYETKMQEAKQRTLRRLAKELGQTVSPIQNTA
jgi:transposase